MKGIMYILLIPFYLLILISPSFVFAQHHLMKVEVVKGDKLVAIMGSIDGIDQNYYYTIVQFNYESGRWIIIGRAKVVAIREKNCVLKIVRLNSEARVEPGDFLFNEGHDIWQFENHTVIGFKIVDGKEGRTDLLHNIFPPEKSYISFSRILSPHFGFNCKIDGLGLNFGVGFSYSSFEDDSITQAVAENENDNEIPSFNLGPNLGLAYYFRPYNYYSYFRLGILLNYFDGPYKLSDEYYFRKIGFFYAFNAELGISSWDNSLGFVSSFSFAETNFQIGKIDNIHDISLEKSKGIFYWFDFTLRYRPKRIASDYYRSQRGISGVGFYFSFRPMYGKLKTQDNPHFFVEMCHIGVEWHISTISEFSRVFH